MTLIQEGEDEETTQTRFSSSIATVHYSDLVRVVVDFLFLFFHFKILSFLFKIFPSLSSESR